MDKPFLWYTFNYLYHSVMDPMPQCIQDMPHACAAILGGGCAYWIVRGLQWTSRNFMSQNFDEKWLPTLEKLCIAAMVSIPLIYAAINPDIVDYIMANHPVYTCGVEGGVVGSITGAAQHLHKHSIDKLEDKIKANPNSP